MNVVSSGQREPDAIWSAGRPVLPTLIDTTRRQNIGRVRLDVNRQLEPLLVMGSAITGLDQAVHAMPKEVRAVDRNVWALLWLAIWPLAMSLVALVIAMVARLPQEGAPHWVS